MSEERRNRRAAQRKYFLKKGVINLAVEASLLDKLTPEENQALNDIIKLATFDTSTSQFYMSKQGAKDYRQYIHYLRKKYFISKELTKEDYKVSPQAE